jgi:hypothetical protein
MSAKPSKLLRVFAPGVFACGVVILGGCASTTVDESTFFADPAAYAMYDCAQLATVRESHAERVQELQRLMAKAETGAGGALVAEVAYRPDYVSAQAKLKSANAAWERNRCASANQSVDPAFARPSPGMEPAAGRSKSRIY